MSTKTNIAEAEECVAKLLRLIGENPDREGLRETPKRYVKALMEMTKGMHEDPEVHLGKRFKLDLEEDGEMSYDGMIISDPLPFVSMCEHHLLPFTGMAYIGYIPRPESKVVGLSKLGRLLDVFAQRLQVQERMTLQIANALEKALNPLGCAVILKGRHSCQCLRGVKKEGWMTTSAMHGVFKENASTRSELLALIALKAE